MKKCLAGLMLFVCLSALTVLSARSPKIDAEVYEAFDSELTAYKNMLPSPKEAGLRVVVQLNPQGRIRPKELSRSEDGSLDLLAQEVFDAQSYLIDDLQQEGFLARRTAGGKPAFAVELLLSYQYAFAATVADVAVLEEIAARDEVASVSIDGLNEMYTVEGRAVTGSNFAAIQGFNGSGVGVAVIDGRFDLLHFELGGSTNLPNGVFMAGRNVSDGHNNIHSRTFRDCYHGTGTASIVRRYASGVDLYGLVVFPNSFDSVIAEAINWCVTNRNGVNGGDPIRVISMSIGRGQFSGACDSGVVHTAAGTARTRGLVLLAASGNNGWSSSMGTPACSSNILSIGATWDADNATYSPFPPANCRDSSRRVDERTCYSNKSPVLDLYAPSERVDCARCGGGTAPLGGTSSACPAAAGMVAQLLEAKPNLIGDQTAIRDLFQQTGRSVSGDPNKRRINIGEAVASCAAPASSMTAWYPLGDFVPGSNAVNDWAGTNNRGTKYNGVVNTLGRVGSANRFDGVNDYIGVPSHADLNPGTGDFTLTAWIRTSRATQIIVTKRNSSDNRGYLLMLYGGRLLFQMADNVRGPLNYQSAPHQNITDDSWHYVAVTVDRNSSSGGRMYIDGNRVHTFNPTGRQGSLDTTNSFFIGRSDGAGSYFQGVLDEVTLYKRTLSAAQIAAEFRAGRLGKCR